MLVEFITDAGYLSIASKTETDIEIQLISQLGHAKFKWVAIAQSLYAIP
jgi:hypothetical protein